MTRLGIIGYGGHGEAHVEAALKAGFELTAVCDPSPERVLEAKAMGRRVRSYKHAQGLIAAATVDAVIDASPDAHHDKNLLYAVKCGKHAFIEKPLTLKSMNRVDKALVLASQNGIVVSSCHLRRKDKPYMWLKERFAELVRQYGVLIHVELDFSYHKPARDWKYTRSLLFDHFSHEIDFFRWLIGDVPFEAYRLHDDFNHYSVAGVARYFEGGATTFLFHGTRMLDERVYPEQVVLRFARATLTVNTKSGLAVVYHHETMQYETIASELMTDYDGRLLGVMQDFAAAIAAAPEDRQPYLTHEDHRVNASSALALNSRGRYSYQPEQ